MSTGRVRIIAVLATVAIGASACAETGGTTRIQASEADPDLAPTTSIVRDELESTTTEAATATSVAPAPVGIDAALAQLVAGFAADPGLVGVLAGLDGSSGGEPLDPAVIAGALGIDLSAIEQLDLSLPELTQVGAAVAAQPPAQREELTAGPIDPAVLVALLAGSGDPAELGSGAIGALINGLLASLSDLRLTVSPELTLNLGELLGELDPDGLGPVIADEANAAVFALLLSAFIGANPVLTEQLLANPLLEPGLQALLSQLRELNASLGDAAREALLRALRQLLPGLPI